MSIDAVSDAQMGPQKKAWETPALSPQRGPRADLEESWDLLASARRAAGTARGRGLFAESDRLGALANTKGAMAGNAADVLGIDLWHDNKTRMRKDR